MALQLMWKNITQDKVQTEGLPVLPKMLTGYGEPSVLGKGLESSCPSIIYSEVYIVYLSDARCWGHNWNKS